MPNNINSLIERINELSRKQRSTGLAEWEVVEQAELRQQYLAFIRKQVKGSLENVKFVDSPKSEIHGAAHAHQNCGCQKKEH